MQFAHAQVWVMFVGVTCSLATLPWWNHVSGQVTSTESSTSSERNNRTTTNSGSSNSSGDIQRGIIGNQAGVSIDALGILRRATITTSADLANVRGAAAMARQVFPERVDPGDQRRVPLTRLERAPAALLNASQPLTDQMPHFAWVKRVDAGFFSPNQAVDGVSIRRYSGRRRRAATRAPTSSRQRRARGGWWWD